VRERETAFGTVKHRFFGQGEKAWQFHSIAESLNMAFGGFVLSRAFCLDRVHLVGKKVFFIFKYIFVRYR